MPVFLLAFGVGGVVGTTLGGRLADWSVLRSIVISNVAMGLVLAVFTRDRRPARWPLVTVLLVAAVGSMLAVRLQMRLMQVAGDAQTLGAALNHASLNMANALGAWLGGLVIAAGFGYTAPSWVGAGAVGRRAAGRRGLGAACTAATSGRRVSGPAAVSSSEQVVAQRVDQAAVADPQRPPLPADQGEPVAPR